MMTIAMIPHIVERAQQRGLRWEVLQFILDYGDVHSGAVICASSRTENDGAAL